MAAVRPIVLVYQDFATVSTPVAFPDLNTLIVGPCYDVLDYATDKSTISMGTFGSTTTRPTGLVSLGASVTGAVPNVRAGAVVDTSSIALYVENGRAEIAYGSDGVIIDAQNTFTTAALTNFATAGVSAGDRLVVSDIDSGGGVVTVAKTVMSLSADGKTIYTTDNFAKTGTDVSGTAFTITTLSLTGLSYRIEKAVNGLTNSTGANVLTNGAVAVTSLTANVTINGASVSKPVVSGTVYCAYRALRTDLSAGIDTVQSVAQITAKLGKIDARNPLALGVSVAFQNTSTVVQFYGVPSDDITGHQTARDAIIGDTSVYAIVPLTQDTSIVGMWKAHCRAFADPAVAKFRIVIGNAALPTTKNVYPTTGATATCTLEDDTTGYFKLLDTTGAFLTNGAVAGDLVTLSGTDYVVNAVLSENRLQVKGTKPVATSYKLYRKLTRDQQVTELKAIATSMNDSRCTMVWPDKCYVTGVSAVQPGYYVSCAVGGMVAGLPPHQGFTFIGLAGISTLANSNTYFYDNQLTEISNAGWFVVVQDTPTSLPYSIHELTTDVTSLESGELMVVKNYDFIAKTYRDVLKSFLGVYNVTKETMDFLRSAIDAASDQLRAKRYPKIGAPLISAEVTSVTQLAGSKDQVEAYVTIGMPRPLNRIGLHLQA